MPKIKFEPTPKAAFPQPGGTIGPKGKYFSLGFLGNGTFCEISKCVDLSYFHQSKRSGPPVRIVAAKVELSDFKNSGVLDGEATILKHLSNNMRDEMIPTFLDYLKTNHNDKEVGTIIMEYLAGEDMNRLRDRNAQYLAMGRNDMQNLHKYRRLSVNDSVYLCKDIFLPLLKSMHDCGAIHRDVKPSNCVRTGPSDNDRKFKLVDFGLSKSFVVPKDSASADITHVWDGPWDLPINQKDKNPIGCIRKERNLCEFRGTSMYASLRVHQLKDYCRRDDIWGLMYVFCDLVSGGLPWMGYAANRDRTMCQKMKEYVHGECESIDGDFKAKQEDSGGEKVCNVHVEELLKGADYHLSKHRRDTAISKAREAGEEPPVENDLIPLAAALELASHESKCDALREAFDHLSKLGFADRPDYDLIEKCFNKFLDGESILNDKFNPPPVHWKQPTPKRKSMNEKRTASSERPCFSFDDGKDVDPLDKIILYEAEALIEKENAKEGNSNKSNSSDLSRLPLPLQFQLAQVEYNATNPETVPIHIAFRDWMQLAISLVYDTWDSAKFERGNHRSNDDGYRRELFLKVVHQCLEAAKPFDNFNSQDCFYYQADVHNGNGKRKRRKVILNEENHVSNDEDSGNSSLLAFSKVISSLRALVENERQRIFAPPPALSF